MMATPLDDLTKIHCRFPILAFLLSLSNPSAISTTLSSPETYKPTLFTDRSPGLKKFLSGGLYIPFLEIHLPLPLWIHDVILHLLAAGCATIMFYQTLFLGLKGIIVFACWTWHNPLTWVSAGGIVHLLRVISWRFCLGPNSELSSQIWTRWVFVISSSNLATTAPRMERLLALAFKIVELMNYGYGTVMLSSMTLVNPVIALRIFTEIGFSAVGARIIALWVLEVYRDVPIYESANTELNGSDGEGASQTIGWIVA
jgi:hypothetical protein